MIYIFSIQGQIQVMKVTNILCPFYFKLCVVMNQLWLTWSYDCNNGSFIVGEMSDCHPWLTCDDIKHLHIGELIGYGAVKHVYQTSWSNNTLAIAFVNNKKYTKDFLHGIEILKQIGGNKLIVQLVGFCEDSPVFLTEYHPAGKSVNIDRIFSNNFLSLSHRFQLCIDYVRILVYLHNSPVGRLMMCDSNTLAKTLEQYLLTSSGSMVLNDVDAVTWVGERGTICGHQEIKGDFVAPEQKWPYPGERYRVERMPSYNEKADVWKIPPVCSFFIGKSDAARAFRFHVYNIHKRCREVDPLLRPSAREVLQAYESVYWSYFGRKTNEKEEL